MGDGEDEDGALLWFYSGQKRPRVSSAQVCSKHLPKRKTGKRRPLEERR